MIINHNMGALNANRQMGINQTNANKSMEKLSSGLRINRAGDDAAGLAISEKMRGQIRGLDQASSNAQDGISLIQTAEGALSETHSILQRMRELAVQSSNDTNTTSDRDEIQKEINQLTSEVNRIANTTEFNTQKLLNGNKAGAATKEVVAGAGDVVAGSSEVKEVKGVYTVEYAKMNTSDFAIDGTTVDLQSTASAADAVTELGKNATLAAKYEFSVDNNNVKITQKVGSATKPTVSGGSTPTITEVTPGVEYKAEVKEVKEGDILTPGKDGAAKLQIGANKNQSMTVEISDMSANALGITGTGVGFTDERTVTDGTSDIGSEAALDVSKHENATNAVEVFDKALNRVSAERSKLGAMQNRLEHTINNLGTSSENLTSAESRIRDVNMAKEMSQFSKNNILSQAAQAMLAQANNQPQQVLQLLR